MAIQLGWCGCSAAAIYSSLFVGRPLPILFIFTIPYEGLWLLLLFMLVGWLAAGAFSIV
jgi:hypothetical protein